MNKKDYRDWLKLISINGLGTGKIQRLLKIFHAPQKIFRTNKHQLSDLTFLSENVIDEIVRNQDNEFIEKQLKMLEIFKVRLISITDEEYPDLLKFIYNPPIILYIKGAILQKDCNSLAIVGTRKPSYYGKFIVQKIGKDIAKAGFTIVSGLAYGIDGYAHKAALDAGGRTIAVCGTGLDTIYPSANRNLANKIVQSGALVSEFSLGSKIEAWNFPVRNRIISGISKGTFVIEGKKTSGALLTAKIALEQNRDIFALPGNINSPQSEGPNYLIKLGAKIVVNAEDILEEYNIKMQVEPEIITPKMTNEEGMVYKLLQQNEKILSLDEMVELSDFPPAQLSAMLLSMELKGIIKREAQNRYLIL
ncbi:MAG: DNA-protecting protein DprA [Candidatus Cloacimonetes bacterium]|nr:DNA-protecting protein DprA [Candidatus Cloacimonadota bacterium]MBL7086032.1 DNA-protecting protein DprA [Candidatus Cloacimonadota bacterium]